MTASVPDLRLWTYDTFVTLPSDRNRYEIIDGELIVTPSPGTFHQTLSKRLQHELYRHVELEGRGTFFDAPLDVIFDDRTVVEPDLVVLLADSKAIVSERGIEGPPDLVVEILSPSTAKIDRAAKRMLYAARGVREYWIVDPVALRIEIASDPATGFAAPQTFGIADSLRSPLLPELVLDLRAIFRRG